MEIIQVICHANQRNGFYMSKTLVSSKLNKFYSNIDHLVNYFLNYNIFEALI